MNDLLRIPQNKPPLKSHCYELLKYQSSWTEQSKTLRYLKKVLAYYLSLRTELRNSGVTLR